MKKFLIICSAFLLLSQLAAAPLKIASYRFTPAVMSADHADSSYTSLTNGDTSGKSRVVWNLKTQKDKRVVITCQFEEPVKISTVTLDIFRGPKSYGYKDVNLFAVDGDKRIPIASQVFNHPYALAKGESYYQKLSFNTSDDSPVSAVELVIRGTGSYIGLCNLSFDGSVVPVKKVALAANPLDKLQKNMKDELRFYRDGVYYILENHHVLYAIDPRNNGGVAYAYDKHAKRNNIHFMPEKGDFGVAFADRFYGGSGNKTLYHHVEYEGKVLQDKADLKQLQFSGSGRSGAFENVRITKNYTLEADSPVLRADYSIENSLDNVVPLESGYWMNAGVVFPDRYSRLIPGENGVELSPGGVKEFSTRDIAGTWFGAADNTGGVAFVMPFELMKEVYFWSNNPNFGTAECKLGIYPIKAGTAMDFSMYLAPFSQVGIPDKVNQFAAGSFVLEREYAKRPATVVFKGEIFNPGKYTLKISSGTMKNGKVVFFSEIKSVALDGKRFFEVKFANKEKYGTAVYKAEIFDGKTRVFFAEKSAIISRSSGIFKVTPDGIRRPDAAAKGAKLNLNFNSQKIGNETFDFAPKSAGKVPRVLAVNSVNGGIRDMIELSRRFEMELTTNFIAGMWSLSGHTVSLNVASCVRELGEQLKNNWDCIVISGDVWGCLSKDVTSAILGKVANGAGLILTAPEELPADLKKIIKIQRSPGKVQSWKKVETSALLAGIPFAALPPTPVFTYQIKDGKVFAKAGNAPLVTETSFGKGKVFVCSWQVVKARKSKYNRSSNFFLPFLNDNVPDVPWKYHEYQMSLLGRLIYNAANVDSGVSAVNVAVQNGSAQLKLISDKAQTVKINAVLRNKFSLADGKATKDVQLKKGENLVLIELPCAVMNGKNFYDFTICNDKGTLWWGGECFDHAASGRLVKVSVDTKRIWKNSDSVKVSVKAEGSGKVIAELFDSNGNCFARSEGGEIILPLADCATKTARLQVRKESDGKVLDRMDFRLALHGAPDPRLFSVMQGWPGISQRAHLWNYDLYLKQLKEFGVNMAGGSGSYVDMPSAEAAFRNNNILYGSTNATSSVGGKLPFDPKVKEKDKMVRTPCLSEPGFKEKLAQKPNAFGPSYAYGVLDVAGPDESNSINNWDGCFSDACKVEFRKYLQKVYPSLEALNKSWQTDFARWEDVIASTVDEARKMKSFASWLDHRTFNDWNRADALAHLVRGINAADPTLTYSLSGTQNTNPWNAWDYYQLMPSLRALSGYRGEQSAQHRSFAAGKLRNCPWVGYDQNFTAANYRILDALMDGASGVSIYGNFNIDPAYELSPRGKDLARAIRVYRNGIAELLMRAEFHSSPVALHYSPASIKADWFIGLDALRQSSVKGFRAMMEDYGITYDYLAYGTMEKSGVPEKYKVLILPLSSALSDKEIDAIKAFVQRGGLLIADLMPGFYDEHGAVRENNPLAELFGVKAIGNAERSTAQVQYKTIISIKSAYADAAAAVTSARALCTLNGKPVLFVNNYGKGKAVYFASSVPATFGDWELMRFSKGNINASKFITGLFHELLHIERKIPALMKSPGMPGARFTARRSGDGFFAAVLRDPTTSAMLGKFTIPFLLQLSGKYHVYDVINKKYLGFTDKFKYPFAPDTQALFALMPYKVEAVKLDLKSNARRVTLNIEAVKSSGSGSCDHTFRVKVYSPDGKENKSFSQMVFADKNQGSMSFVLPLNLPEKNWKFEVTDIISGITESVVLK